VSQGNASAAIRLTVQRVTQTVEREMASRAYRASNELRNAAVCELTGGRSAPGQSPGSDSGIFRLSWMPSVRMESGGSGKRAVSYIESEVIVSSRRRSWNLGELLEDGTRKMAARPHHDKIRERAMPRVTAIYSEPFNL